MATCVSQCYITSSNLINVTFATELKSLSGTTLLLIGRRVSDEVNEEHPAPDRPDFETGLTSSSLDRTR